MKNIKILGLALVLSALVSCNMDKYPYSSINTDEAMESAADCYAFRNALYSNLKFRFTGTNVYVPDLQCDLYHAVKNFGNWSGAFYYWGFTSSDGEASTLWNGSYSTIANANFLIEGVNKLLDRNTLSQADVATVSGYLGEAYFIRAAMYYAMAERFCKDYEPGTAEDEMGLPLVTVYAPTSVSSKYPGRSSLAKTYELIVDDLANAEKLVTAKGAQNSAYITTDVVAAMQARVALMMHDYDTAISKSTGIINSGTYTLISDQDTYSDMWVNDKSTESLWTIAMTDSSDTGSGHGYFIYNQTGNEGEDHPHYIPEDWVLKLYQQGDIRYNAYFRNSTVESPFIGTVVIMSKYPGNPKLYPANSGSNYVNMPKVLRLAEMYLIAAESYYLKGGQEALASQYLNKLKSQRIAGWEETDYSGVVLRNEIRDERVRELYGEGFRLSDLKRWGIGFSRSAGQDPSLLMPGSEYAGLSVEADNNKFLWPIPISEMQSNPQIKQNPGF